MTGVVGVTCFGAELSAASLLIMERKSMFAYSYCTTA